MLGEGKNVDDPLLNLLSNLKPKMQDSELPLKRSFSSSGIFDYVTPAKKTKKDTSVDYISSPREARRMRADLLEAKNAILSLEGIIQHMHSVRKETQIVSDNELESLAKQHNSARKLITELEEQLQTNRKRESDVRSELAEVQNKYDTLKLSTDQRIEELEKGLADFKADAVVDADLKHEEIVNLNGRVEELEVLLEAAEEDAEAHKKLCAELGKRLSQKNAVERNLEIKEQALQKARLELKELEYVKENYVEYQQQVKSHQHKMSVYADLERENRQLKEETKRLRDAVHNKLLLEEEVYDLKNRLVNYKKQEKKLAELQVEQVQSEVYLNEWRAVARGVCESTGADSTLPHLLRGIVERLQQQEINLTSDKVQFESQLNAALHEAKVARSELEKNQKHLSELQTNIQQRQNLIQRMQKKLLLVSRERDSYRLQLDSYERDLTMCMNTGNSAQVEAHRTQRERIENLERIVEGYKDMVVKLENDLQNAEPNTNAEHVPIRAEQIARLQEELNRIKMDNDHLREQRNQLEIQLEQLLVGNDVNSDRIVHLAKDPLAESTTECDSDVGKLQEEVERLNRKIREMEEGFENSKLEWKEQLQSSENALQKLKDYFSTFITLTNLTK